MILPNGFEMEQGKAKIGGSGVVYTCTKNGKRFALKVFSKNFEQYYHEVYICKTLKRHNNVIELIDHFELSEKKAMVLEYCSNDLKTHLQNNNLSFQEKLILIGQICSSFKAIQQDLLRIRFQFQHRDIKPENFLIDDENQIKLIDFGESRIIDIHQNENNEFFENGDIYEFLPSTQLCGTPGYMDPMMEYMNGGFKEKSDIWSLGATFFYILTNKQLQISKVEINLAVRNAPADSKKTFKINKIKEMIESQIHKYIENEKCKKLLINLLQVDLANRYDWNQLFKDEFIAQLLNNIPYLKCQPFVRKNIIRLKNEIKTNLYSTSFNKQVGMRLTQDLTDIIQKGLYYFQTAQKILSFFCELKEKNQIFLNNWQDFEKCNYLMHLRSLFVFYNTKQILTQFQYRNGTEYLCKEFLTDLQLIENQHILERLQLQFYYLFDCVRKSLVGNGLEARLINLQKFSNLEENYTDILQFKHEEKIYFSYKQYDRENILNDPEYFEKEEFYQHFQYYLLKCIECCFQNYQFLKKNSVKFLFRLILICDYDKKCESLNYYKIKKHSLLFQEESKMHYLFLILKNFCYLKNLIKLNPIFNTYFYFEILYFSQSDINFIEKLKQYLRKNFPFKQCFIFKKDDENKKNILLNIKCQLIVSQIFSLEVDDAINFKKIIQNQVEKVISNSQ